MRRQVWVEIACENLGTKTKQLYWNVIGWIEKEKHEKIHKYFSACTVGEHWAKWAFREDRKFYGLLCLFQEEKCVYSFKLCFEDEWIFLKN